VILLRVTLQTVGLAIGQIWANKTRALLTALGIIIGVGSVVAVIAALTGMKQFVLDEFESIGATRVYIDNDMPRSMRHKISWRDTLLTIEEIDAIKQHAPSITKITPRSPQNMSVQYGENIAEGVGVTGIWPDWHDIEDRHVTMGRPFIEIDETERRNVCLVNDLAIEELNLDRDPTGEYILVGGRRFLIVGVVETKDLSAQMFGGRDTRVEIFVPFSTMQKVTNRDWIHDAFAQMSSPEVSDEAQAEVSFILRNMRDLGPEDEDTFEVFVTQQAIDQFTGVAAGITAVAGGVVSISLLVGGIGIMNIMLVSVSERTREIGLRKAVGARPSIILLQFLVEAVVLCSIGGLIGLVLGQSLTLAMQQIPSANLEKASIPPWAIALAFAFSAGVGIVFGMFPAIKASRLDPIEALRHE